MRKSNEMMYVKVVWLDARSEDGWTDQDELDVRLAKITTIGHAVDGTEDRGQADVMCIACSVDETTGQVAGVMFIPKVCIVSREQLVYDVSA